MQRLLLGAALLLGASLAAWLPARATAATLVGAYSPVPQGAVVDLTAQGPVDWVHWGMNTEYGFDRKASVPARIGTLIAPVGGGEGPYQYGDNYNGYSWTDGTPNTFATNTTTGLYVVGSHAGFQLTIPADTVLRRLKVYVGAYGAQGQFDAALSDKNAPTYSDLSIDNQTNGPGGVYTLDFAADSADQSLTVTYAVKKQHDNRTGNVTWQAAALSYVVSNNPPTATLISPPNNATFSTSANVPLAALASDTDGTIAKVEFFQGSEKLGEATNGDYTIVWSNPPPGDFLLTAVATDDGGLSYSSKPVEIFVNSVGGTLSGSVSNVPATVDLTAEGVLDWAHWGAASSDSFDHKAGVQQQISNFKNQGTQTPQQLSTYLTGFSWTDGIPTTSASATPTGVYLNGTGSGFELTVPATSSARVLKLYVGVYAGQGNLQAFLSDFSAPAFTDSSVRSLYGNAYGVYTLNFSAAASNQDLHVRFTSQALYDLTYGSVSLEAASLTDGPPVLPPQLRLLNACWCNGVFTFCFDTQTNRLYTVEYTDSLAPVCWQALTNVLGDGTRVWIRDAALNPVQRLYRVRAEPATVSAPPQPVTLLGPGWTNGLFMFSFVTESNRTHVVEYTDSLRPAMWHVLSTIPGDGTTTVISNSPAASRQRYYRVQTQ